MGSGLRNIGLEDAIIRIIVGFVFIFLGAEYSSWVYYSLAVILVTTAIVGFCPFYVLFNINTNKRTRVAKISKDEIKKAVEGKIEIKKAQKNKNVEEKKEKTNKSSSENTKGKSKKLKTKKVSSKSSKIKNNSKKIKKESKKSSTEKKSKDNKKKWNKK